MKIYILDDDRNIVRILEQIITEKNIGNIVGTQSDSLKALEDIKAYQPDIVIVDLLMPDLDGVTFVEKVRGFDQDVYFIMVSQVTSKEMISKAYEKGVNFYIQKPINAVEVLNVLSELINHMETKERLQMIKKILGAQAEKPAAHKTYRERLDEVFKSIGILSRPAVDEITDVVEYMIKNQDEVRDLSVKEICEKFAEHPKSFEQKIRRSAMVGLENLAYLGVEDNLNEKFMEFSNSLYHFKDVKTEMDFIRGRTDKRGKVNIRKFLDGLAYYVTKE